MRICKINNNSTEVDYKHLLRISSHNSKFDEIVHQMLKQAKNFSNVTQTGFYTNQDKYTTSTSLSALFGLLDSLMGEKDEALRIASLIMKHSYKKDHFIESDDDKANPISTISSCLLLNELNQNKIEIGIAINSLNINKDGFIVSNNDNTTKLTLPTALYGLMLFQVGDYTQAAKTLSLIQNKIPKGEHGMYLSHIDNNSFTGVEISEVDVGVLLLETVVCGYKHDEYSDYVINYGSRSNNPILTLLLKGIYYATL